MRGCARVICATVPSWVALRRRASSPALVAVMPGDWTYTRSISVSFLVVENGITSPPMTNGWCDGITLDVLLDDRIFANGFDPL